MAAEINGVKPKWSLMDMNILHEVAYNLTVNEEKHTKDHYQKTKVNQQDYFDKTMRHLIDSLNGKLDPDTGLDPLIHAISDIMIWLAGKRQPQTQTKSVTPLADALFKVNSRSEYPSIVQEAMANLKTVGEKTYESKNN